MKNKIYYLGWLIALTIAFGCLFKINHFAGAGILITVGLTGFALVFLPLAFTSLVRSEDSRLRTFYILAGIVLAISAIGIMFKVMHWPGAGTILLVSLPMPFLILLPYFLLSNPDEKRINFKYLLAILFFFAYDAAIASLLATRVSANITFGYIQTAIDLQNKSEVLHNTGKMLYLPEKVGDTTKQVNSLPGAIQSRADVICDRIDNLRKEIVERYSGNKFDGNMADMVAIKQNDALVFADTSVINNLKQEVESYAALLQTCDPMISNYAQKAFVTGDDADSESSWAYMFRGDRILADVLQGLNLLEYEVRLAEVEAVIDIEGR